MTAEAPPITRRSLSRRRTSWARRWLRRSLWSLLALGVLGGIGLFIAYTLTSIPEPNGRALQQRSTIYYSDGKTVLDTFAEVNRQIVPINRVPKPVQYAFLAAEDRSFYSNNGISPKGIARSVWVGLKGGPQQGGSTITQQYVKNYFLTQDRTVTRKAKEILISIKIDKELPKDRILESYLNTIYFGRGADGIQTAAQAYFGTGVENLDVAQGAVLASVIRGPSLYDPGLGPEQLALVKERWVYVLDGMVDSGWLTASARASLTFPEVRPIRTRTGASGPNGFVVEMVKAELMSKLKLTEADIEAGGFRIVTTIDKRAQDSALAAVTAHTPVVTSGEPLRVGLAAVVPGDGAIRALYGGPKYATGELGFYNTATRAGLQAGSTYKVWTLIAALERGLPLSTWFSAHSPQYFTEFKSGEAGASPEAAAGQVVNFANHSYGVLDMTRATALSANTYFARLNIEVTPKLTKEAATKAGLKPMPPQSDLGANYANVFGTDLVSVLDQANAYATIAAEGKRSTPYVIASMTATGALDLTYKAKPNVKQVFEAAVMRDAIQAMHAVTQPGGTGAGTLSLGRPAAGKTGTTTDNYSAWFDGFTPGQLSTAVGMYRGDGSLVPGNQMNGIPGVGELTGGTVPVAIWTAFMQGALQGQPVMPLPPAGNSGGGIPTVVTRPNPGPPPQPPPPPPASTSSSSGTSSSTTSTTSATSTSTSSSTTTSTTTSTTSSTTTSTTPPTSTTSTTPPTSTTSPGTTSTAPTGTTLSSPPIVPATPAPTGTTLGTP